jgi:hypothetical protein
VGDVGERRLDCGAAVAMDEPPSHWLERESIPSSI